jgi:ribosomal protein S18 acetylase RimI-like enzyme
MRSWGCATMRLDTATFLTDAIALYRRLGFVEIAPYYDLPPETQRTTVFMELRG